MQHQSLVTKASKLLYFSPVNNNGSFVLEKFIDYQLEFFLLIFGPFYFV